jgi:hypothetical protein
LHEFDLRFLLHERGSGSTSYSPCLVFEKTFHSIDRFGMPHNAENGEELQFYHLIDNIRIVWDLLDVEGAWGESVEKWIEPCIPHPELFVPLERIS